MDIMPNGTGIEEVQSVSCGYFSGYPGLFRVLFIFGLQPIKEKVLEYQNRKCSTDWNKRD